MTPESIKPLTLDDRDNLMREEKEIRDAIIRSAEEHAVLVDSVVGEEGHDEERERMAKLSERKAELERKLNDVLTRLGR